MNLQRVSTRTLESPESPSTFSKPLRGLWRLLARTTWVIIATLALVVYVVSLPMYFGQIQNICVKRLCVPGQLTLEQAQVLHSMGLPFGFYAVSIVLINIATMIVWVVIGIVLFWRKPNDWLALLVGLSLVLVGASVPPDQSAPVWQWPIRIEDFLSVVLLFLIFSLFPSGRFVPHWMRWFSIVYCALNVLDLFPTVFLTLPNWLLVLYFVLLFGCIGLLCIAQIYRYRRVSGQVERQQIKWVVFGCATAIWGEFILWILTLIFPALGQINSLYDLYFSPISIMLILLIPLSLGFAILRYRLWEIDVLINRTLVYSILTGTLALVYFGLVIALQYLLHEFTGGSALAIIGSTLAIAALFQPLRHNIQTIIDRRFYRRRYNATQTLASFSAELRDQVDLTMLINDLMLVVQETMQPTHVSLWLRMSEKEGKHTTKAPGADQELRQLDAFAPPD